MSIISKGSEWNIWDLHFHTPTSFDYKNKEVKDEEIINKLKENNVKVVAITDHHIIDIKRINNLILLGKAHNITVLPGIEFLSDARGKEPIHFIGIFSEDCNLEHVWGQIQHKTNINKIASENKRVNDVYCDLEDTVKLVRELGGITTIHAGQKHGSLENITNSLDHNVAQKKDIADLVDIFELGKESDQETYTRYVFPKIEKIVPMIMCSDNHNIRTYQTKQKLWIKGEASFNGLKYALNEPTDRFFIGEEPTILKRVRDNKTKYISRLKIKLDGRYDANNIWFDEVEIPLNSELITIIGHKGNGKSAISDIIALCADAEHSDEYLFLHKNKFKKRGLADRFKASIEFISNSISPDRNLNHTIDSTQQSLVRYLPQSYFEKVCNEIGKAEAFKEEIEKVVFQYISKDKRLGTESFKDLLGLKKKAIEHEINSILERLKVINDQIIDLEDQSDPNYKESLKSKIKIKEDELEVHRTCKPIDVLDPSLATQSFEIKQKKIALAERTKEKEEQLELNNGYEQELRRFNRLKLDLENLIREINTKVRELNLCVERGAHLFQEIDINKNNVFNLNFNEELITNKITHINQKILEYINLLDDRNPNSPNHKIKQCQNFIESITSEFTGEQKAYQDFIDMRNEWSQKELKIIGSVEDIDSLTFLNSKLNYIEQSLLNNLSNLRDERRKIVIEIFNKKSQIKSIYDEIKMGIEQQLEASGVGELNIASKFDCDHQFRNKILKNIRQNKIGSFYGADEGGRILQDELISQTNWNDQNSVVDFFEKFLNYLEYDMRTDEKKKIYIGSIITDRSDLYEYIFSLNFLEAHYDLQNNGKSLDQLSPGEKGALLLVFYLVLDKEDIPLIIDQPEDNLDNNSVAKILVPYIKYAKKKRQIILVTHNPNLAVVADSEQVIKVSLDKKNGHKFSFIAGGIENKEINTQILEVLEGTIPAFCLRKDKYSIS